MQNPIGTYKAGQVLPENGKITHGAIDTYVYTVPKGKKWKFIGLYVERDVNATLDVKITLPNSNLMFSLTQLAAGVSDPFFPEDEADADKKSFLQSQPILGSGWRIVIDWSVAQVTPTTGLWVEEV